MGEIDRKMKEYFSDRRRYADLWNGGAFGGRQLIREEELEEAGTVATCSGPGTGVESIPDAVMKQMLGRQTLAVWILQDQTVMDYSMPARVMLDEAMRYHSQVQEIRRKNRGTHGRRDTSKDNSPDPGEYLYGFRAEDRLVPAVTLVVYWGKKPWDGPVTLHGMMDFQTASGQQDVRYMELEGKLRELVPDYPIHILDLSAVGDYSSFKTELRLLFELYACRDSREKLKAYLESHEECSHADTETCRLLGTMMDIEQLEMIQEKENGEGGADMCKALMEWSLEERAEGKAEGKAEGEERMACLTKILLDQHKMSDLDKMLSDTGYRNKLFQEYGLT